MVLTWHPCHPPPTVQMGTLRSREVKRLLEVMQSEGWDSAPCAAQSVLSARDCGELGPREQQSCQCPLRAPIVVTKLWRQLKFGQFA